MKDFKNFLFIKPISYLDIIVLEKNAKKIITDSGGVQKEAYFLKVPCITLRQETEWLETLKEKWNILVGIDKEKLVKSVKNHVPNRMQRNIFGDGKAAEKVIKVLKNFNW